MDGQEEGEGLEDREGGRPGDKATEEKVKRASTFHGVMERFFCFLGPFGNHDALVGGLLVSDFFSFFSDVLLSAGFTSGIFTSPDVTSVFFSSFLGSVFRGGTEIRLSVLYHPLPLKCTAGGASNFSTRLLEQAGQEGFTVLPKGRVNSKICWQDRH